MKIQLKKGNASITMPIVLLVSMIIIIYIGFYLLQVIQIFMTYEKINTVALKYLFIVEQFGYITNNEKEELINDLCERGLKRESINLNLPEVKKEFGELVEFTITYSDSLDLPRLIEKYNENSNIPIKIVVRKSTLSKK